MGTARTHGIQHASEEHQSRALEQPCDENQTLVSLRR